MNLLVSKTIYNHRMRITLALLAGLLAGARPSLHAANPPRPNIVLILADDLGHADLGFNGCKDVGTPNIDSIAANGIRFEQGYVTAPICSPSRTALLTGRHNQRWGQDGNDTPMALPLTESTLGDRLKELGYATGCVGKWHVDAPGQGPEYLPTMRGFDEVFHPDGNAIFFNARVLDSRVSRTGFKPAKDKTAYTTELNTARAVELINQWKDQPFFLYLAYHNVHMPLEAPQKYLDRITTPGLDPERRTMAAMVLALDDGVGEVMAALRQNGIEENTMVIFLNDNGGVFLLDGNRPGVSFNAPLNGGKYTLKEGGIRVPFLMQWKARFPQAGSFEPPVSALDVVPTVVAACGGVVREEWSLDGVNLLPYLEGKTKGAPHEELFWRVNDRIAMRKGDWKLHRPNEGHPWELFNLKEDIGEARNLAKTHPEKLAELHEEWQRWNARMAPPQVPAKPTPARQQRNKD